MSVLHAETGTTTEGNRYEGTYWIRWAGSDGPADGAQPLASRVRTAGIRPRPGTPGTAHRAACRACIESWRGHRAGRYRTQHGAGWPGAPLSSPGRGWHRAGDWSEWRPPLAKYGLTGRSGATGAERQG